MRSYTDGGQHYAGQIGSEATPTEYISALVACTREWVRVLKPSGSLFINLGDKYSTGNGGDQHLTELGQRMGTGGGQKQDTANRRSRPVAGTRPKCLLLLPERYRIACVDQLGLIARAVIVWAKCLSGGTEVYAKVNGREKVAMIKDLARCPTGSVELWTGEKWSAMLRCDPTPPTEGRTASSAAARSARYRSKPIPPLAADLEIEFRNGERVGCTPNHKWPTSRGIVRADELAVGDVVPAVRLAAGTAAPSGLDDDLTGWLVGLYIAEGSRSEDMVQIASHIRETERFARLQEVADAFDGRFALHHTKGNTATANLSGKVIRAILDTYVGGRTAKDKRLSPAGWRRSDRFLRAVLDGYLSGDGHYEAKTDRWVLGFTSNDGLTTDLRAIAARLGYSLRLRRTVHHFDGRDFPGWGGTLYTDPARRRRPDGEVVAVRQSRARQFWNVEIADDPHEFALASGLLTENSNGLPESVTDRVRRSHEDWVHLTKAPRYYAAVDEIREAHEHQRRDAWDRRPDKSMAAIAAAGSTTARLGNSPLGKLPGSVWEIPTEPLQVPERLAVDHFAAFPSEWPRRLILGWSPSGICTACGEGRRPVAERDAVQAPSSVAGALDRIAATGGMVSGGFAQSTLRGTTSRSISGYACDCGLITQEGTWLSARPVSEVSSQSVTTTGSPVTIAHGASATAPTGATTSVAALESTAPPTRPAVVLDPFGGTGTTAHVAAALGRTGVTVDLSMDYSRLAASPEMADRRLRKVLGLDRAEPVLAGQLDMFGEVIA